MPARAEGSTRVRPAGLTLLEVLVVIAILSLLMALLLQAVQQTRETARKIRCRNNLKQVGLAAHMHHSTFGRLPSGWTSDGGGLDPGWSWASALLPYLQRQSLANDIDKNVRIADPVHAEVRRTVLPLLVCPSDPTPERFWMNAALDPDDGDDDDGDDDDDDAFPVELARVNYVGVYGSTSVDSTGGNGSFFRNSRRRFRDFRDGQSQTMIIGEKSSRLGASTWVGVVSGPDEPIPRVVGSAIDVPNSVFGGLEAFGSHHVHGAHFLMADGTVRLISEEIDLDLFRALSTINGGEVVADAPP